MSLFSRLTLRVLALTYLVSPQTVIRQKAPLFFFVNVWFNKLLEQTHLPSTLGKVRVKPCRAQSPRRRHSTPSQQIFLGHAKPWFPQLQWRKVPLCITMQFWLSVLRSEKMNQTNFCSEVNMSKVCSGWILGYSELMRLKEWGCCRETHLFTSVWCGCVRSLRPTHTKEHYLLWRVKAENNWHESGKD